MNYAFSAKHLAVLSTFVLVSCQGDVLKLENKPVSQKIKPISETLKPKAEDVAAIEPPAPFSKTETLSSQSLVLAFSWQAGFCENHEKKSECQSQRADRYDATHFTLHGLWPKKIYCNVSGKDKSRDKRGHWRDLPFVQTSVATRQKLQKIMPGTRSALDRHEWTKHGTCYSKEAETYYKDSLALMDAINASSVQKLFANNIGKNLDGASIRAAFDKSFGRGTGKRVRISCKNDGNRRLITELTIGLRGVVGPNPNIGKLTKWASRTKPGCPGGIVDAVGFQ